MLKNMFTILIYSQYIWSIINNSYNNKLVMFFKIKIKTLNFSIMIIANFIFILKIVTNKIHLQIMTSQE